MPHRDTIFAVSSGRPPAAIAIIRVSGPRAVAAVEEMAGSLPQPRRAGLRALRDAGGALVDRAIVLVFPGPATATGEDLVELHCHGGRAVVAAVEAVLAKMEGVRPAAPGEFTRRALMNGRMDLTEAEGLADLLEAETESQRIAALGAVEGRVSRKIRFWLDLIATLSARVEAVLDFADEGDVVEDDHMLATVRAGIGDLASDMEAVLAGPPVERLRDGIRVVIAGPPNSGKSTLLNLLTERDAAIVSPVSGTTRDRIEASVVRRGISYVVTDTAGLTDTDDPVEAIGIDRAYDAMRAADILLWLGDDSVDRADALHVHARMDLPGRDTIPSWADAATSEHDRDTIEDLWCVIEQKATGLLPQLDALPLRQHQRATCALVARSLRQGLPANDLLVVADELRVARVQLAALLGVNATEITLDRLFSRFCLGK